MDSHATVRNDIERSPTPFTQFLPEVMLQDLRQDSGVGTVKIQNNPSPRGAARCVVGAASPTALAPASPLQPPHRSVSVSLSFLEGEQKVTCDPPQRRTRVPRAALPSCWPQCRAWSGPASWLQHSPLKVVQVASHFWPRQIKLPRPSVSAILYERTSSLLWQKCPGIDCRVRGGACSAFKETADPFSRAAAPAMQEAFGLSTSSPAFALVAF